MNLRNPEPNTPWTKPLQKPTLKTVPGTAIANMAINSIAPFPMNLFLTTRKAISMEIAAVMILATKEVQTVFQSELLEDKNIFEPISVQFAVVQTKFLISKLRQKVHKKTRK